MARIGETVDNLELGEVRVRAGTEPYNVLVAFHEDPQTHAKLVLALVGWVMHEEDGNTACSLHFTELLLQPGKLAARILSLPIKEPIDVGTNV